MIQTTQYSSTPGQVAQEQVGAVSNVCVKTSSTGQASAVDHVRQYPRQITEVQARAALTMLKGAFHIEVDNVDGVSEDALRDFSVEVVRALTERWPMGEYPVAHRILELGNLIQVELAAAPLNCGENWS
jgi:hypothetical protein